MKKKILPILLIVTLSLIVLGSGFSASANTQKQEKELFLGLVAHRVRNSWEDLYSKAFSWYTYDISQRQDDLKIRTTKTEAGLSTSLQITQAKRLIDMGIDGLIIAPWGVDALRTVMDYAKKNNVPVITTNTVVNSSYPLMFVGYGSRRGCKQLGERIIKYLKTEVKPIGKVEGTILELGGKPGNPNALSRGGGFHEAVDKYKNVKVITKVANSQRSKAKTKTINTLRGGADIDAVFAQNGDMGLGANDGLKAYSGISPKDVYIATVDAFPAITDEIDKGNIDVGLDQPPAFYNPIAVHYIIKYLEEGKQALPDYGETITADELKIRTGNEHLGVDPWAAPIWAPAKIKHMTKYGPEIDKENDHRWFQTNAVFVTKENCNSPILWGNFPLPGW